jgi:hypothetical protein
MSRIHKTGLVGLFWCGGCARRASAGQTVAFIHGLNATIRRGRARRMRFSSSLHSRRIGRTRPG